MSRYSRWGFFKNKHNAGTGAVPIPLSIDVTETLDDANAEPLFQNINYTIDTNRPNATITYNFTGNITTNDFTDNTLSANITLDANGNATISKTITGNISLGNVDFALTLQRPTNNTTLYTGNIFNVYKIESPVATGGNITTDGNYKIHTFDTGTSYLQDVTMVARVGYPYANKPFIRSADVLSFRLSDWVPYGKPITFSGISDPNWSFLNGNTYVCRYDGGTPTKHYGALYDSTNTTPIRQATGPDDLELDGNEAVYNNGGPNVEVFTMTTKGDIESNVFTSIFGVDADKLSVLTVGAGGGSSERANGPVQPTANILQGGGGGGEVVVSTIDASNISANTAYAQVVGWSQTGQLLSNAAQAPADGVGYITGRTTAFESESFEIIAKQGGYGSVIGNGGSSIIRGVDPAVNINVGGRFSYLWYTSSLKNGGGGAGYNTNGGNATDRIGGSGGYGRTVSITGTNVVYGSGGGGARQGVGTTNGSGGPNAGNGNSAGPDGYGGGAGGNGYKGGNGTIIIKYVSPGDIRFISNVEIT